MKLRKQFSLKQHQKENIKVNLYDLGFTKGFSDRIPKAQSIKEKIK